MEGNRIFCAVKIQSEHVLGRDGRKNFCLHRALCFFRADKSFHGDVRRTGNPDIPRSGYRLIFFLITASVRRFFINFHRISHGITGGQSNGGSAHRLFFGNFLVPEIPSGKFTPGELGHIRVHCGAQILPFAEIKAFQRRGKRSPLHVERDKIELFPFCIIGTALFRRNLFHALARKFGIGVPPLKTIALPERRIGQRIFVPGFQRNAFHAASAVGFKRIDN